MNVVTKILIVEHDPHDVDLIRYELKKGGLNYISEVVQNEQEYSNALLNFMPDIILCDYSLPSFAGPTAFKLREQLAPETPFIFVSGIIGDEISIEYIKNGVTDYVLKDKLFMLTTKVKRALKESIEKLQKIKIEKERIQGESSLKEAQTIAHMGSWEIDMVHNTHHWSDEMFNIFGIKKGEALPSKELLLSFILPDDVEFANKRMEQAFITLTNSFFNFRFTPLGGTLSYGCSRYRFEFDQDQKPLRIYGIIQDITEKTLADEALNTAHEKLLFHMENTPLGFIEWDSQLVVRSWSKRAEKIFGWTEKEFIDENKTGYDLVYSEDLSFTMEMTEQLLSGKLKRNRVHHRNCRKDGRVIWCEWFNSVFKDKDGKVITIMSLVQDITERKEAEQQKEFDRNNLKALVNNTDDLMWSLDRDFKIISSNLAFDELIKVTSGDTIAIGTDILRTKFKPENLQRFRKHYERAFSGESFTEVEYSELPAEFWAEISYYPIYKEDAVVGTACFSRNITKRKKAESHLRLLESVITNANDAVLITDAGTIDPPGPQIVYVNSAFTKMTGYEPDEIIGTTPRVLQGPKSDRLQLDKIREALLTFQSIEVEIVNYKKNGEEFWNNFTIVPITDKDGDLTHFVSIQRDVTARKTLEETTRMKLERLVKERTHELNAALKKEKEHVEMKNKFVTIASHEFRTPLSTISFAAESIRNYFHQLTAEEITRKLIKIEDQASHMTNLLEDILTLGKSEAGKIKVKRVSLDLREFIESIIEEVRVTVKEKRTINFTFSCASKKVSADDKLLRNVFNNLLTNALKFSAPETPVTIAVSDCSGEILVEVTDQGIGIEESELSSVFESFQRGSNASAVQGTGLGLSILKKAVELMDGSINVKSSLKKGSTFSIRIPMK